MRTRVALRPRVTLRSLRALRPLEGRCIHMIHNPVIILLHEHVDRIRGQLGHDAQLAGNMHAGIRIRGQGAKTGPPAVGDPVVRAPQLCGSQAVGHARQPDPGLHFRIPVDSDSQVGREGKRKQGNRLPQLHHKSPALDRHILVRFLPETDAADGSGVEVELEIIVPVRDGNTGDIQ
ncbi:MAG: hypothetical protein EA425_14285 [Puniceicoccaceae bacterium]|nr:MAG: hypothetical protein EA425_14285 [Puniceicoccaceae bacterium]